MAGKSLWKLCAILSGILLGQCAVAQDSVIVRWYIEFQPQEWILRKDIAAFAPNGNLIAEPTDIVSKIENTSSESNLQVVHFKNNTSSEERASYVENLRSKGIKKHFLVISKPAESGFPFTSKLLFIDDRVMIVFKSPASLSELEALAEKYNLELVSENGVMSGETVYVFRYKHFTEDDNSVTISAKIYETEKTRVRSVHPNRVNLFEPQSTNDTYIDLAWYIANDGQQLSCSSLQGQHQADAHITGAWNLGYTGQGIKVGVIDFYGFDYAHPDMQGQILPGWDCINNTTYNSTNFYFTDVTQAHGMAVCGVIAANANNNIGSAGVAYGAKVVPFLIDGSEASVVLAMQKARSSEFDVDVVNCSFGSYFQSPAIQAEIQNLVNHGRVRNGNTLGVTVVTSHGNDNYNDFEHPQYPAAYDEVISVSASTPDDKRKVPGDAWETTGSWGTNYGSLLDIAAPGVCIFTTDISGTNGYSTVDYVAFQKTSASAPIVSGVAALVLSKYPNLNWQDLRTLLRNSADKTNSSTEGGGYNYHHDASKPGQSLEMGYGRVNAEKAVSDAPTAIGKEAHEANSIISITSFVQSSLDVRYRFEEGNEYVMAILDMSGKILLNVTLPAGNGLVSFDVSSLISGMYFVRCISGTEIISNEKFIKAR